MSHWWDRYPDTYAAEIAAWNAIRSSGYTWKEDEVAKASGRLVIHVELKREAETFLFAALYPDAFPYFQAHVQLHNQQFARHHHPFSRNLCLIGREGEGWRPGHDTTAALLAEKFPDIAAINADSLSSEEVKAKEDHIGEPASSFPDYVHDCVIIVPDQTPPSNVECGLLALMVRPKPSNWVGQPFVSGVLKTISDANQRPLVQFSTSTPSFSLQVSGFWIRLTEGCWHCFQQSIGDGTIRQPADLGPKDIQPAGCSQPTYIGAGIDSDEIALLASRLAVATLCRREADGYADFDWDVAVADMAKERLSIAPNWTQYKLARNKSCAGCNAR